MDDLDFYERAKLEHPIYTYLKDNMSVADVLGKEKYKALSNICKEDHTTDGIIDYLHGSIAFRQISQITDEQMYLFAKDLNKIERCIDWNKGTPQTTTEQGYINFIGDIGEVYKTKGITSAEKQNKVFKNEVAVILQSYLLGEWGEVCADDKEINDNAIKYNCDRILARYKTSLKDIYIITEIDRSATTILFTDEY